MPQNQAAKGNPATKRMLNERKKATRKRSWLAGQERKKARREEQARREVVNRELREMGLLTPYEASKVKRKLRKGVQGLP